MKKLNMADLNDWLARINDKQRVYLPVEQAGQVNYGVWTGDAKVCLDTLRTVKSAKDAFFPQVENMMNFKAEGKSLSVEMIDPKAEDFVVLGVRACDAKSFEILDRVFLSDPYDPFYAARREHSAVVTLACGRPDENCFCVNFGIDPADPQGDATMWIVDDTLYLRVNTEKGEVLVKDLEDADDAAVKAQQAKTREVAEKLPFAHLNLRGFDGDHLMEKFNDPHWAELSRACLGCGTCTFVCPTCQCYDIRDFDTGREIRRFRCWDSCMYSDFTKMAGGNPRLTQKERFRQRFMHKLVYFPENNGGEFGCVGCGRCLRSCPIHMNIVKVMKRLGEDDHEQ